MRPLEGVLVVDGSSGFAGPLAAMLLGDLGAEVVVAGGAAPPEPRDDPVVRVWGRGKRRPGPAEDLEALLVRADVHVLASLDDDLPPPASTRQVQLAVPPFLGGRTPWAGGGESDPLLAAVTGVSLRQASVEDVPVDSVYRHLLTVQGVWAAAAAVAALAERESSGLGQRVTVGGLHGAMIAAAAAFTFDGSADEPRGRRPGGSGGAVPFYRTYRCADGEWLFLAALTPRFTALAFDALRITDLLEDPRLEGRGRAAMLLPEHAGWAIDRIAAVFAERPRDEWLARLAAVGCPAGPLLDRDDWLDHPQLAAIGMVVEHAGAVMPGPPIHLAATDRQEPGAQHRTAPERRDSADADVRAPAGSRRVRAGGPTSPANRGQGPLRGVRVLDLGAIIAGPFAASLLAELGADVIKVEPLAGDSFRGPGFAAYNKGQRGIALDLQHPEGRRALLDLVAGADLVVDNYRPGVLGRLRLRHDDLVEVQPTIGTLSITGFGEGGPMGGEPGFDPVLQAMSGMMRAQGGSGDPVFFTVPVNDVTTAALGALTGAAIVLGQRRHGVGARAWLSLAGTSALLQAAELARYEGRPPAPVGGTDHPGPAADDRYHRVADGWVRVHGAPFDPAWSRRSREDVLEALTAAGVAAAPALTVRELLQREGDLRADDEVLHRDPRPGREHWWTAGRHARFSRTEATATLVAPSLGEHTREVLLEAGFEPERVERLVSEGIAAAR